MTREEAKKMLKAKLECLKHETSGMYSDCNRRNCDECSLNYEQGNMGEQKEALDMAIKALEQQTCEDTISRKEALDALHMCLSTNSYDDDVTGDSYICYEEAEYEIEKLPSVQPKYNPDEWCHDCSEYNHDKHCCPRYNKVIRNVVEEIKQPKTGQWVLLDECSNSGYYCSKCHKKLVKEGWSDTVKKIKYCPNCGAKMIESQESEEA